MSCMKWIRLQFTTQKVLNLFIFDIEIYNSKTAEYHESWYLYRGLTSYNFNMVYKNNDSLDR